MTLNEPGVMEVATKLILWLGQEGQARSLRRWCVWRGRTPGATSETCAWNLKSPVECGWPCVAWA